MAAYTALMLEIYRRTGSALWLSAALFLTEGAAGFLSPVAGAIGDRFDRRRVMIGADLAAGACFAVMVFVHEPSTLLLFAFASAVADTAFLASSMAAIPSLVEDPERISWANSTVSVGRNAGIMLGPVLGGLMASTAGTHPVYALNAVSFLVSAALVFSVRARFSSKGSDAEDYRGLRAGFLFLARERVLRRITVAWSVLVLGIGMSMVADVPLVDSFGAGSVGFGLLIGSWGAGSVLGSISGRVLNEGNEGRALVGGTAGLALGTGAVVISPWFAAVLIAILVAGFADALAMVAEQGILQRRTPDAVRSRVSAAVEAVLQVGVAVSFIVGGFSLRALGPKGVYAVGAVVTGVTALMLLPILRPEEQPKARNSSDLEAGRGQVPA